MMTNKLSLTLYSTLGCHLCELAEDVACQSADSLHIQLNTVDIADHETLLKEFGTRIPVIKNILTGEEIAWPFDLNTFDRWLAHQLNK